MTEFLSVLEFSKLKMQWREQEQLFLQQHSGKMLKAVKEAQKMINEKQSILGLDVNNLELRMQDRGGSA